MLGNTGTKCSYICVHHQFILHLHSDTHSQDLFFNIHDTLQVAGWADALYEKRNTRISSSVTDNDDKESDK